MECENCPRMRLQAEPTPTDDYLPINCYVCNASGWIAGNNYRHSSKCTRCNGTGKINFYSLTNEDFLRMATTEQLADVLADVFLWIHPFMKQKNRFELLKKQFYVWLKQPHSFE